MDNAHFNFLKFALFVLTFENSKVSSQYLPSIACPDKFQYISSDNNYTGKLTIYGALVPSIKVEALFSQRKPKTTPNNGNLTLIESRSETEANLLNGRPITYRVDFPEPQLFPKLIRLRVNDRTICSDNGFPAPSTTISTQHTFFPSAKILSRSTEPNRLINPFDNTDTYNEPEVMPPTVEPEQTTRNFSTICGQEGSSFTLATFEDNDFERGRFPWLIAVFIRFSFEWTFRCSGSLISTRTVITSALCLSFQGSNISADDIFVYLGRHNFYAWEIGVEQRSIEALIIHPGYKDRSFSAADIALMHMKAPVSFNQFIRPICLWSSSTALSNKVGYIATWGSKDANLTHFESLPKVFEVDIVNETACLNTSGVVVNLNPSGTLCAGSLGKDFYCLSVYGSGLMIKYAGTWILRSILTSFASKTVNNTLQCNASNHAVFCDLSQHITWVRRNMLE